jgi:pimeloyl-ACP methyl ester carboxylesterase
VAIDLAGHGASGRSSKRIIRLSRLAQTLPVVKHLGHKRMVLIGHSMGGDVIAAAAKA